MNEELKKKINLNGSNKHLLNDDTIDDLIDIWHESESILELHEFLGLSLNEYFDYVAY